MTETIRVRGLRKAYGALEAVRGVDFHVGAGEIYALLGPNGAGKTTIVEVLEGYRDRDAGDISVLGADPADAGRGHRERVGIVLQSPGILPYLTVAEAVDMYRGYYPHPRPLGQIIELVGLQEKRDARANRLSGGEQRRLDVAIGLAGDPDLLFLDEPTTGFDPAARRHAWEMVEGLRSLGKSVLLTTHYMDEAEHLADRVGILVRGQIVAEGPPSELRRDDGSTVIRFRLDPTAPAPPARFDLRPDTAGGWTEIETETPTPILHDLTSWAVEQGIELHHLTVTRASLEDTYLRLTREAEDTTPSPETDDG